MSKQSTASTGLSFGSVLFFIFLIMKLTHYIDWSWWWVTAPLWAPLLFVLVVLGLIGVAYGMIMIIGLIIYKLGK